MSSARGRGEPVTVVGAGVVGLSCAVRLAEAGFDVEVVAREAPLATTSAVAAAIWYPYRAYPNERVLARSTATYAELCRLAADEPRAGVRVRSGTELMRDDRPDPWWASAVPAVETVGADRVPAGYGAGGASHPPWSTCRGTCRGSSTASAPPAGASPSARSTRPVCVPRGPTVRLECQRRRQQTVVHCYGHGG